LGTPTGDHADIVSLGDLEAGGINPGEITLVFGDPNIPIGQTDPNGIKNVKGYDFAVFENGFISGFSTSGGSLTGQMLSEFAFVEVSSNGVDFVRFPSVSLTAGPVGAYGTVDVTDVYNLAGKHPNAYGICTGVPGSGEFFDQSQMLLNPDSYDPNETPHWTLFTQDHPVYDAWLTWESGGFDLEAVGVLQEQEYSADINLDGRVDLKDFGEGWVARCDLTESRNLEVDIMDLINFSSQWLSVEQWAILAGSQ
jgi:hypothetical protein